MTQPPAKPAQRVPDPSRRATRWWIGAAVFVGGVIVGVVLTGLLIEPAPREVASTPGEPGTTATVSESPATTGTDADTAIQIVVNNECLRAVNEAQDAYTAIDQLAVAVRELDLTALDIVIRQLQPLQQALRDDIAACHVTARLPNGSMVETSLPQEPTESAGPTVVNTSTAEATPTPVTTG